MNKARVLFTGGTGFIGRNVLPILKKSFIVYAPNRQELNLFDEKSIRLYILNNNIDFIVHCANPNPSKNTLDKNDQMLRSSLQMFMAMYSCKDIVKKIVYLGSGAVYDKTKDISSVIEEEAFRSIPSDDYGFAKYIMNQLTIDNIYNLCVFGCYGPYDADSKFITHCIKCCLRNEPITIRQNCFFDYLHVYDLGKIIVWALDNELEFNMFNACSGQRISLFDIAQLVKNKMNSSSEIIVLNEGWNKEYTGSNARLRKYYCDRFVSLEEGILMQIEFEQKIFIV